MASPKDILEYTIRRNMTVGELTKQFTDQGVQVSVYDKSKYCTGCVNDMVDRRIDIDSPILIRTDYYGLGYMITCRLLPEIKEEEVL